MARDPWSFTTNVEMAQYYDEHPEEWLQYNSQFITNQPNPTQSSPVRDIPPPGDHNGLTRPVSGAPPPSDVSGISRSTSPASDPFGDYLKTHPGAGDAWAYLSALLNDYGLGQLTSFVRDNIVEGRSQPEVVQRLRETDVYKKRFAAIEQRKAQGLPAISEGEVVAYERQATQLLRAAGLPQGFWDSTEDFTNLLVKDVSLSELSGRINDGYVAAMQAPAEERAQLQSFYGVTTGQLAAYYLDPDRAEATLKTQFAAAQASAEGVRSGYGALSVQQAERLAALGVTSSGAQQGFKTLQQEQQLFGNLPGEGGDAIARDTQLAAAFGNDAGAQQQIIQRQAQRVAAFAGGGGYESDKTGKNAGIGVAQ